MNDTVLIVDDSLTVRMDLHDAFEAAGFHPHACATLAAAREALVQGASDVIVLDVVLPDGDGIELLKELRAGEAAADAVVLLLSSEAEVKDRVRGLRTGADEYVGKPYDVGYVVAKARELLRAQRGGDADARPVVLVVEDSPMYRETLGKALEAAGYRVRMAVSGEEGLRAAAAARPAAIIVDDVLPGIDGTTVIRRLRLDAALRGVPCLLLTGAEDRDAELRALDAGADAFVRKEEDIEVILARLGAALRSAKGSLDEAASLLGPKKVLAVDDSPTHLAELAATLRDDGYDVVLARSGEEALDLLAVQAVDCILLDLLMPGLGGRETCRRIKSAPIVRDIPLIMLTALDDRSAMLDGLSAGADDYIQKAGEFEVLKARVRAQIRRKHFEDENRRIREELLRERLEAAQARAARNLAETRALLVEELERKNRELEAFSYSVAHDLRGPLRSIDGLSYVLLEQYADKLDGKGGDYLNRVRASAKRMAELIDDLLELSRVSATELRHHRVDLAKIAQNVVMDLRHREPGRVVDVRIHGGLTVMGDTGLLKIVLENLIGNAWKFTGKTEAARIECDVVDSPHGKAFVVRDNGVGFDMDYSDKLFGVFQRMHAQEDFPGTGIGLATVQRIVERHGGKVWAESRVGEGARFYVALQVSSTQVARVAE